MATKKKSSKARKKTTARKKAPAKKKAIAKARPKPKPAAATSAGTGKVTPYLCCKGGVAALEFYKKAFGGVETLRIVGKDGSLGHGEVEIEGAAIMVSDEAPDLGVFSPHTLGGSPVSIHLYVKSCDATTKRAVAAGATVLDPVSDRPYGDRSGSLRDPFGHRWMISTKREEVSKEEMEKRFGGAYLVT